MKSILSVITLAIFALQWIGCSSFSTKEHVYKNSALDNQHPAPAKMSPPNLGPKQTLVDPVYLSTQADYHYSLAEAYSLEGNGEKAIEEFKLTLVYDSKSSLIRLRLAAEYVKLGMLSEAIEQAEEAVRLDPKSLKGHLLLGGLYSTMKMYELAMREYDILRREYPDNMDIPVYAAALLAEQGEFKKAEKMFLDLAKHPKNKTPYKSYYYVGRILLEQGDNPGRAENFFMKSLQLHPNNEDSVIALSQLYQRQKQNEKAIRLLESFLKQFGPKQSIARILSQHYLETENYKKALEQLEHLESFDPSDLNVKVKMALILIDQKRFSPAIIKLEEILLEAPESYKILFYLGAVHEELENRDKAIQNFLKIPSSSSYYGEAIVHAAYLYKEKNDYSKAIQTMESALFLRQDIPQFYAFLGSLYDDKRQYQKAVDILAVAVSRFPKNTQLRFFLGSMQDKVGNSQQTIAQMRAILELDPKHTQALNYLAYTFAELNQNLNEAKVLAQQAMELKPQDPFILDTMGWVLFKQGRVQESIKYLEEAHKLKPDESIVSEHLGDAYFRYELTEKAKKMYLKAISFVTDKRKKREIQKKIYAVDEQIELLNRRRPASN